MGARNIDVRSLKRIVMLAKMGSFTRAAECIGVSQSVLTRSIQDIERDVGAKLFERDKGGVYLSSLGRDVVREASVVLRTFEDFSLFVDGVVTGTTGRVAIGVAPAAAPALLPGICADLLTRTPEITGYFPVRRTEDLLRMLLDDEIDLFICAEAAFGEYLDTKSTVLGEISLSLLVRPGHPLLQHEADASRETFPVIAATNYKDGALFPDYFWDLLHGRPTLVVEDHECLSLIAERSDAIWVTSKIAAIQPLNDGRLVEIPSPEGQSTSRLKVLAHGHKGRTISPAVERVLQEMRVKMKSLERNST
jgi:DNA-binding transcriptional LysR family regulator